MLGTTRRDLPGEIAEWLDGRAATDPTAGAPEHLLAAIAITERLQRLRLPVLSIPRPASVAPAETGVPPTPRMAKALQLILDGTYPGLLDEAMGIIEQRGSYVPAPLLPALHLRSAALLNEDYPRAVRYTRISGQRGSWLARQHPDWRALTPGFDYAAAWKLTTQPAPRSDLLCRWRAVEPHRARNALREIWGKQSPRNQEILLSAMEVNRRPEDVEWLRSALPPKRKRVRRAVARLLLLHEESSAVADFERIARTVLDDAGRFRQLVTPGEEKELLGTYGGIKAPETVAHRLLCVLPPDRWRELSGRPLPDFYASLDPPQLKQLTLATIAFGRATLPLVHHLLDRPAAELPATSIAKLAGQLTGTEFDRLYERLLTDKRDALRLRGLPRRLALLRRSPWSERLSRAFVTRLLEDLRSRQLDYATQRELAGQWKLATPLLDPEIFGWLRQQMHTVTERYDAFGKLAVDMLQTTAFRREMRKP